MNLLYSFSHQVFILCWWTITYIMLVLDGGHHLLHTYGFYCYNFSGPGASKQLFYRAAKNFKNSNCNLSPEKNWSNIWKPRTWWEIQSHIGPKHDFCLISVPFPTLIRMLKSRRNVIVWFDSEGKNFTLKRLKIGNLCHSRCDKKCTC